MHITSHISPIPHSICTTCININQSYPLFHPFSSFLQQTLTSSPKNVRLRIETNTITPSNLLTVRSASKQSTYERYNPSNQKTSLHVPQYEHQYLPCAQLPVYTFPCASIVSSAVHTHYVSTLFRNISHPSFRHIPLDKLHILHNCMSCVFGVIRHRLYLATVLYYNIILYSYS